MNKIFNKDGFIWWIGVVEDRKDPEQIGRVRVRIYGYHPDDKTIVDTIQLPWAVPILPITSASISGKGQAPLGPVEGSWVIGFFLDGEDMQQPAIFGTISTKATALAFTETAEREELSNTQDGIRRDASGNPVLDENGEPIPAGTPPIDGWSLGKTSEKYESGNRGPGVINNYSSSNDTGGASYGSYQFASFLPTLRPNGKARPSNKGSPVTSYIRQSRFKEQFAGLTPGTESFDTKWKEIASKFPKEFEDDQHNYVKRVYYDALSSSLRRSGLDLSKFGPAVQDLIWSTAVQYGPGRTDIFTVPLQGKSQLTDKDIINHVSEYKIQQSFKNFASSGSEIVASQQKRYSSEKNDLLGLIKV
jgi:hypothetical protein